MAAHKIVVFAGDYCGPEVEPLPKLSIKIAKKL